MKSQKTHRDAPQAITESTCVKTHLYALSCACLQPYHTRRSVSALNSIQTIPMRLGEDPSGEESSNRSTYPHVPPQRQWLGKSREWSLWVRMGIPRPTPGWRSGRCVSTRRTRVRSWSRCVLNRLANGGSCTKRGNRRGYMYDHAEYLCLGILESCGLVKFDAMSWEIGE